MATVEQLLAVLSIDSSEAIIVSGSYAIIQRDPQPDEAGIPIDTDIGFLLVDLDQDPLAATINNVNFTVSIEGIQIASCTSGVLTILPPWGGSITATTSSDPFVGWYVTIEQPVPSEFSGEQVIDVKITLNPTTGFGHAPFGSYPFGHPPALSAIDFEYSFTIEDLTPPKLLEAEALDLFTIRVTFDDEMSTDDGVSVADISMWQIDRMNEDPAPAVNIEVVSVGAVSDSNGKKWDLTIQWEMTQGCTYEITANPLLEDESGNSIDSDYSSVQFTGYQIPTVEGRRFSHWLQMIPEKNRIEDLTRDLERFSGCIQEVLNLLLNDVDRFTDQFDPDLANDEVIEAMLYDMGNPFDTEELGLSGNEKRKLLSYLIDIYKQKGTAQGIESAVLFMLGEIVTVVPYIAEGWILGEDELGNGGIAEILCKKGETYDFSSDKTLEVETDGYVDGSGVPIVQAINFTPTDFDVPGSGLASEVVDVINAQLNNGGAYVVAAGTPAIQEITGTVFSFVGGESFDVAINGELHTVVFRSQDIENPGYATQEEVANRIASVLYGVITVEIDTDISVETLLWGSNAEMEFVSGSALAILGIAPGTKVVGTDALRLSIYSETPGTDSMIGIVGGDAMDILGFEASMTGGTGGAILAPGSQYILYSFDIETQAELDEESIAVIRSIAEYMKAAHEHLINIRTAPELEWPDGWLVGVSELGETTELME